MAEVQAQPADYQLRRRQTAAHPWTFEAEFHKVNADDLLRSVRSKRTPEEIFDGFVFAIAQISEQLNKIEMIEYRERTGTKDLTYGS